ncbi:hypothetical protein KDM41_01635 [bacterium]|nr:hypothetical protein [bacterium]
MKGHGRQQPPRTAPSPASPPRAGRSAGRAFLGPLLATAALLVLTAGPGLSQAPGGGSRLRADRFIDRVIEGEPVSCMYGNVFIDRDTTTAASDSAFYYRDRELYEFVGRVRLTRGPAVLTCDWARYNRTFGTGDFRGNVRLVEGEVIGTGRRGESRLEGRYLRLMDDALLVTPDYSVRADTIFQDRATGHGEAFGNVKIMEPGAQNLITGRHAVFHEGGEVAEVDRDPVLVSREQSGGAVRSEAGLMRFFRAEDRVVMVDSVRIRQGQTLARADTAVAYGRERMVLTGSPSVAMGDQSVMYGDQLDFRYRDGELRQLIIVGNGRMEDAGPDSLAAVYQGLPTMDVLEGDSITVDFENRELRRSVVVGNAHSLYTPRDLSDEVATNDVTGDTITIFFRRQKVARVKVLGNADGRYRFARVAAMREMLGKSRRMADLLARGREDSTGVVADSLSAEIDSLAGTMGLPVAQMADGVLDSLLAAALDSLASAGYDTGQAAMDFLAAAQEVKYGGRTVTFVMADRTMELEDEAHLEYGTLNLKAGHIKLDTDDRELYADREPLVEDTDTIAGRRMGYNFKHKSAAVQDGVTAFDDYYYVGDEIRRFEDQTMKICGGRMTSCDRDDPHYHFWTGNMKMRPGDKVVAQPIVLRVGHVPVFALPFYYKSLKQGRQSGILFPNFDFGWSSREGRYIRDFGYYWATNDYMDFLVEGDYNERREFAYRLQNRYVKRYGFNGGIDYARKIGLGDDSDTSEWQFRWNHNQPILWDDYKFRADVKMASTTLSSNDLNGSRARDIVSGQLSSNAYLSRSWKLANASLNMSRDERVNATDDDPATDNLIYSMTLPSLSLNFRQITLAPGLRRGEEGSFVGNTLRNVYFQQGYSFRSSRQGYENHDTKDYAASGTWSLAYRPPRLGIFNVSFSANAGQTWTRSEDAGTVWSPDENLPAGGFATGYADVAEDTRPSLRFATTVGTVLYGIFPLQVGRLRALRHTARFNTSFNATPGLGDKQRQGTSISLGFDNRFDLKYLSADSDTTLTEKKLDGVIDWGLRTSYDPDARPGTEWGDISSDLTIKPGESRYLKLKVSNSIDPYLFALKSTRFSYGLNFSGRLDVGQVPERQEEQRNEAIARLGVDLAAAAPDSVPADPFGDGVAVEDAYGDVENFDGENSSFYDMYNRPGRVGGDAAKDPTEGGRFIPFDVSGNLSYNYTNASGGSEARKTASASVNMRARLTANWDLSYNASFDLAEGNTIRQQYSLNRELHCWRFEFNRTVSATNSEFGFRIYLKSIPDLKFARGRDNFGTVPGGLGGGVF